MSKYIDAEAFKRRILSYGIVHEGDRIPIPYYKPYFAEAYVAMLRWVCEEVDDTPAADVVEKEKYDRLLENSLIVSSALQKYQKADVAEVNRCKTCFHYKPREYGYNCTVLDWDVNEDDFCSRWEAKDE